MKKLKSVLTCAGLLILVVLMLFCALVCVVFAFSALISCFEIGKAILVVRKLDYIINCLLQTFGLCGLATISGVASAVCRAAIDGIN